MDITGIKKMEKENLRLTEMLLHSQKIESIGRLAGGIAHDFNNLLMAISGNTEMILDGTPEDCRDYSRLKIIKRAAEAGAKLTRQLLAFSRRQVIEQRAINLNELIEHLEKIITSLLGENIKVQLALDRGLDTIRADQGQMDRLY